MTGIDNPVHVFWDNSNVFIPAKFAAVRRDGGALAERSVRIQFDALYRLAHAGRPITTAVCVGSSHLELHVSHVRLRYTPTVSFEPALRWRASALLVHLVVTMKGDQS